MKLPKIKDRKKALIYGLSFALPILSMIVLYALLKVYPFGDKTVLVMDLDNQYNEFFVYLHRVLTGKENLTYAFSKELGGNTYGLFTYYLSSPFSVLALFFPQKYMPECIALMILLKIGLSGLAFAVFIRHTLRRCDLSVVLFSCVYALSTYAMFYSMCVMWLDAMIWLPIVLLGIERVIRGKSPLVFIAAYAITLISNYYTAYMTGVFSIIYYIYRYVTLKRHPSFADFFKKAFILLGSGAVCALLATFIIVPTYFDMIDGKFAASIYEAPGFFNQKIFEIPRRMFIGQYDTILNAGSPPIFCGTLCGIMALVYFFNKKVKLKAKLAALCVFAVLFVSFFIKEVDIAWHAFNYPMWFPYRYGYVFCFFAAYIAFMGFSRLSKKNIVGVSVGAAVFAALLLSAFVFDKEVIKNMKYAVLTLVAAAVYIGGVAAMILCKKQYRPYICGALILLTCSELIVNGRGMIEGLDRIFKLTGHTQYINDVEQLGKIADDIKNRDKGFYRAEKTFKRTDNDNMSFGVKGIGHYSSTFNNNVLKFNTAMGLHRSTNISRYHGSTLTLDSFFGVKYLVSDEAVESEYKFLQKEADKSIYENPTALSIGFAASKEVTSDIPNENSGLKNQNRLSQIIFGRSTFGNVVTATPLNNGKDMVFQTEKTGEYYIELSKQFDGVITVTADGKSKKYENTYNSEEKIIYIGKYNAGTAVTVSLPPEQSNITVRAAMFDGKALSDGFNSIPKEKQLNVTDSGNTWFEGDVTLGENQLLFTTIPYARGWSVYVDGEKTEPQPAFGTFMAVSAGAGKHHVKFKFHAPGFRISIAVSLVTLMALLAVVFRKKLLGIFVNRDKEARRANG